MTLVILCLSSRLSWDSIAKGACQEDSIRIRRLLVSLLLAGSYPRRRPTEKANIVPWLERNLQEPAYSVVIRPMPYVCSRSKPETCIGFKAVMAQEW